jgi:hypothetical protein
MKKYFEHFKAVHENLIKTIKSIDLKNPIEFLMTMATLAFLGGLVSLGVMLAAPENDPRLSSVMITNRKGSSGGTGVILSSQEAESVIITNAHVCKGIQKGGVVVSNGVQHQIIGYKASEQFDLCLVKVASNLGVNTKVADKTPEFYDHATISGHPALLPNVISEGHYSGRRIIEVLVGVKECTKEDLDTQLGIFCLFFGGIPIIKNYESQLVTALIMPGSSGSGVYNSKKELTNLVFAGSGDLAYAWTVPHEQVVNFINIESKSIAYTAPDQTVNLSLDEKQSNKRDMAAIAEKCKQIKAKNETIHPLVQNICSIVDQGHVWAK